MSRFRLGVGAEPSRRSHGAVRSSPPSSAPPSQDAAAALHPVPSDTVSLVSFTLRSRVLRREWLMVKLPKLQPLLCPELRGCSWTDHGRKHFPHRGLTKDHTRHRPAKYLPGTKREQIRAIETATVSSSPLAVTAASNRTEYRSRDGSSPWLGRGRGRHRVVRRM